jgi:glycogen operon protein
LVEITWLNWSLQPEQEQMLEFTQFLLELYRTQTAFQRCKFFHGQSLRGEQALKSSGSIRRETK